MWETLALCLIGGKYDDMGIVNGGCVVDKVRAALSVQACTRARSLDSRHTHACDTHTMTYKDMNTSTNTHKRAHRPMAALR